MLRILILGLFLLATATFTIAQSNCACCTEKHQQFDFWVGDWNVYNPQGVLVGENTIVKLEDNCILNEHWRGTKGSTGRSYNYFDAQDNTWNQLWIANNGSHLKLKGEGGQNRMVLKSEVHKNQNGVESYNQITWTKNEDGTVTQLWEVYNSNGEIISVAFNGLYKSK